MSRTFRSHEPAARTAARRGSRPPASVAQPEEQRVPNPSAEVRFLSEASVVFCSGSGGRIIGAPLPRRHGWVAGPNVLVDPAWIAAHLDDPLVRRDRGRRQPRASYDAGHIPGALLWNAYVDLRQPRLHPDLPDRARARSCSPSRGHAGDDRRLLRLRRSTSASGCCNPGPRPRLVMDGDRERWRGCRRARLEHRRGPTPAHLASTRGRLQGPHRPVAAGRPGDERGARATVLLDVRALAEFAGERFWPSGATEGAGRAGHIPGARPRSRRPAPRRGRRLREPAENARAVRGSRSSAPDKGIVDLLHDRQSSQPGLVRARRTCSGIRMSRVYYGSWAEWGSRTDTPVAT